MPRRYDDSFLIFLTNNQQRYFGFFFGQRVKSDEKPKKQKFLHSFVTDHRMSNAYMHTIPTDTILLMLYIGSYAMLSQ